MFSDTSPGLNAQTTPGIASMPAILVASGGETAFNQMLLRAPGDRYKRITPWTLAPESLYFADTLGGPRFAGTQG